MALLSSLSIGTSVYMNVDGTRTEFIKVHQGLPDSTYDSSCDGTWLMMKNLYVKMAWDSSNNDYANSDVHSYLNNTFLSLLDSDVQNIVKQVKIPYRKGTSGATVTSGSSGLSTKVFLPSYAEMGYSNSSAQVPVEGAALNAASSVRVAKYNNVNTKWWLRSPHIRYSSAVWIINIKASEDTVSVTDSNFGVRPTLILPSDTEIDSDYNISPNKPPTTPGVPTLPTELKTNRNISVSWSAATDVDGDTVTYELEYSLNASGNYTGIYTGTNTSTTCVIPSGTESIIFRVRAHDTSNAYSSYATSATLAVVDIPIALAGNTTIGGITKSLTGEGYVNIGGVWKQLVRTHMNINGVWVPEYILYTWKKYEVQETVTTGYEFEFGVTSKVYTVGNASSESNWADYCADYLEKSSFYNSRSLNAETGEVTYSGQVFSYNSDYSNLSIFAALSSGTYYTSYYNQHITIKIRQNIEVTSLNQEVIVNTSTITSKGTYITDVESGNYNAYPEDGIHTDGYWYVRQASNKPLNVLPIGSIVNLNIDGTPREFIVVHQGNPNPSVYDSSCNGTWLLMKDCEAIHWDTSHDGYLYNIGDYSNATVHSYMNSTFLGSFDGDIQGKIKQVKIPYTDNVNNVGTVVDGANGLSTKLFLLSIAEIGMGNTTDFDNEGTALSYFNTTDNSKRTAHLLGTTNDVSWWTRSVKIDGDNMYISYIYLDGDNIRTLRGTSNSGTGISELGFRPALILPSSTMVDSNNNVIV